MVENSRVALITSASYGCLTIERREIQHRKQHGKADTLSRRPCQSHTYKLIVLKSLASRYCPRTGTGLCFTADTAVDKIRHIAPRLKDLRLTYLGPLSFACYCTREPLYCAIPLSPTQQRKRYGAPFLHAIPSGRIRRWRRDFALI